MCTLEQRTFADVRKIKEVAHVPVGHCHSCAAVCSLCSAIVYSRTVLGESPGCLKARKAVEMWRGLLGSAEQDTLCIWVKM